MSLYNMIYGVNPATFFFLPMLGKHPDEYPRFRNCFVGGLKNSSENDTYGIPIKETTEENVISIYTRVGGGNREGYADEINEMRKMPNYLRDYDDDFDCTYATFVFSIPEKWKADYDLLMNDKTENISKEYINEIKRVFPKLIDTVNSIFNLTL